MSRQKKMKFFIGFVLVLYIASTLFGFTHEDGAMGQAMERVERMLSDSDEEETSSADQQEELSELFQNAMPDFLSRFTKVDAGMGAECRGKSLAEALVYLAKKGVTLEEVQWGWDARIEDQEPVPGGTVLLAEPTDTEGARLIIQYGHDAGDREGFGVSKADRSRRLEEIEREVASAKDQQYRLLDWLIHEDPEALIEAIEQCVGIGQGATLLVEPTVDERFALSIQGKDAAPVMDPSASSYGQ